VAERKIISAPCQERGTVRPLSSAGDEDQHRAEASRKSTGNQDRQPRRREGPSRFFAVKKSAMRPGMPPAPRGEAPPAPGKAPRPPRQEQRAQHQCEQAQCRLLQVLAHDRLPPPRRRKRRDSARAAQAEHLEQQNLRHRRLFAPSQFPASRPVATFESSDRREIVAGKRCDHRDRQLWTRPSPRAAPQRFRRQASRSQSRTGRGWHLQIWPRRDRGLVDPGRYVGALMPVQPPGEIPPPFSSAASMVNEYRERVRRGHRNGRDCWRDFQGFPPPP